MARLPMKPALAAGFLAIRTNLTADFTEDVAGVARGSITKDDGSLRGIIVHLDHAVSRELREMEPILSLIDQRTLWVGQREPTLTITRDVRRAGWSYRRMVHTVRREAERVAVRVGPAIRVRKMFGTVACLTEGGGGEQQHEDDGEDCANQLEAPRVSTLHRGSLLRNARTTEAWPPSSTAYCAPYDWTGMDIIRGVWGVERSIEPV